MRLGTAPFRKERWLPADWLELEHSALVHALNQIDASWDDSAFGNDLDERVDILRAATCLYWVTSEDPELFSIADLESYVQRWGFKRPADRHWAREDWIRAFVHVHASAALLAKLHFDEGGFSERARELFEDLASLSDELQMADGLHEPDTYYRDMPDYFNRSAAMRRSLVLLCSLAWCFKFHAAREDSDAVGAFEAAFTAYWVAEKGSSGALLFFAEPTSVIESHESVLGSFAWWIRATDAAAAFEDAYESPGSSDSWAHWAMVCEMLKFGYSQAADWLDEHRLAGSEWITTRIGGFRAPSGDTWFPTYPPAEFFAFAKGLCISHLSQDEYRNLRAKDESEGARERLQRYFFQSLWDDLPDVARGELIAADQVGWAQGGSKAGLPGNLRRAAETILKEQVVEFFREWRKRQGISIPCARNPDELSALLRDLKDNRQLFYEFAAETYPEFSKSKWQVLMKDLGSLVKLRNRSEHPEDRGPVDPGEVASEYRKFIGIGGDGVVQRLLRYRLEPQSK